VPRAAGSRHGTWAAIAVMVTIAGVIASVLGARAVARSDASETEKAFHQDSAALASTLTLAIQHEEDLSLSAATFFAANPNATPAQFNAWAEGVGAMRRYPELQQLEMISLVRAPDLPAFTARLAGRPLSISTAATRTTASTSAPAIAPLTVSPSSAHHYYCLTAAEVSRTPAGHVASGHDYCAGSTALLVARNDGALHYGSGGAAHETLVIFTPVYLGGHTPPNADGRHAASVGWLREALMPALVLERALRGHPDNAIRLTHGSGSTTIVFASGTPVAGAQSRTVALRGGWTLHSFGPAPGPGVFSDADAVALLITGIALSVLAGLMVYLLGTRSAPATERPAAVAAGPRDDLYDPLTGLPNRALMLDRADRMLARASRQSGMLVGALFVDIDWFKDVTDRLGREAGDQMLKTVAERLEGVIRTHDTVGRLGGDEFVVLVESAARGARLDSLARRIIEALHKPVDIEGFGPSVSLTASIGVAFGRYTSPDDLLRDARTALIAAKAAGKDRYTVFNANMRSVVEGRGVLEIELNTAIHDRQFYLLFEPVRDLADDRIAGLEAHIRWRHPTQGVLEPADFVPLAEETGLIVPVGRWVLEEACTRAAALNVDGPRIGVSVKVSDNQLNRDGFITDVRRALHQSGIEPSLLTLEVAETTVMRDLSGAAERLDAIKELGVRVAIDDFGGSGYAYHSDLRRLPLDFLKVDRSSLAATDDVDYRSWLLEAILIVGRDLSLSVIATGIATAEQVATLQSMGCTMAQGPFVGEPVPAEGLDRLLNPEAYAEAEAQAQAVVQAPPATQ
jgi:diguanylate cyclase (GGDEF)-like protein